MCVCLLSSVSGAAIKREERAWARGAGERKRHSRPPAQARQHGDRLWKNSSCEFQHNVKLIHSFSSGSTRYFLRHCCTPASHFRGTVSHIHLERGGYLKQTDWTNLLSFWKPANQISSLPVKPLGNSTVFCIACLQSRDSDDVPSPDILLWRYSVSFLSFPCVTTILGTQWNLLLVSQLDQLKRMQNISIMRLPLQ